MAPNGSANPNRRSVIGKDCRDCDECGRFRTTADGEERNWQYLDETTGIWGTGVFCSKACALVHKPA